MSRQEMCSVPQAADRHQRQIRGLRWQELP